jgi:hypothetical protein
VRHHELRQHQDQLSSGQRKPVRDDTTLMNSTNDGIVVATGARRISTRQ